MKTGKGQRGLEKSGGERRGAQWKEEAGREDNGDDLKGMETGGGGDWRRTGGWMGTPQALDGTGEEWRGLEVSGED